MRWISLPEIEILNLASVNCCIASFASKNFAEILPRFILKHASHEAYNYIFLTATLVFIGLFRRMKLVQARPWGS